MRRSLLAGILSFVALAALALAAPAVTSGLGDFDVRGLAVSPADPLRVLAGTRGGVFHSGDGGARPRG